MTSARTGFGKAAQGPLIRFNNTYRDAIQSLFGTNVPAEEIVAAHPNAHKMGCASLQTCGGTFFDVFQRKGFDPGSSIETINAAYPGIKKTALFRGDCLLTYNRQPFDVIQAMVLEHAKAGVNVLQNFHGLNDTRMTAAVAESCRIAREDHGFDITAQGAICIEDNPNVTLESCMQAARELVQQGHQGFYLKSASGRLDPEFVRKLVGALIEEFPEQSIDLHAHDLYGEAIPAYVAAIEAAVGRGHSIGVDVLHPAIAGNTAQPSITKVIDTLRRAHGAIKENLPCIDVGPINTDKESLLALRFKYRDAEICPSARLLKAMYKARVPGGASATLRSIPGLEKNLQNALGTTDWEEIQLAIYEMQARILPRLGNPTQVTPYALMTTKEAAFAVLRQKMGLDPLSSLTPETVDYLTGALGRVPESVEPGLIALALKSKPRTQFVPATELPSGLPAARAALAEAGVSDPTNWELLTAAVLKDQSSPKRGLKHVVGLRAGTVKPQIWPEPDFTAPGQRQANWIAKGRRPGLQPGSLRPSVAEVLKSNTYLLEAIAQDMVELDRYARQPFSLSVQPVYGPRMDVEDREIVDLTRMQHARTVLNFNMDQFLCRLEWAGAPRRDILSSVLGLERLIAETCRRKGVQDVSLIPSLKDHWYVFPRYEAGDPDLAAGQ
jgi:pyruvate/oxaloacetate carboxyltransferase